MMLTQEDDATASDRLTKEARLPGVHFLVESVIKTPQTRIFYLSLVEHHITHQPAAGFDETLINVRTLQV